MKSKDNKLSKHIWHQISRYKTVLIVFLIIFSAYNSYLLLNPYAFYYQQDEYYYFWLFSKLGINELLTYVGDTHYYPLNTIIQNSVYEVTGLSLIPKILISTSLHTLYIFIVLLASLRYNKGKPYFAVFILLIFMGINGISIQAYTWMSTYIGTINSSLFGFISIILFINFVTKHNFKYLFISLVALIVSILFKEYYLFLFPTYLALLLYKFILFKESKTLYAMFVILSLLVFYMYIRFIVLSTGATQLIYIEKTINRIPDFIIFVAASPANIIIPQSIELLHLKDNGMENEVQSFLFVLVLLIGTTFYLLYLNILRKNYNDFRLFNALSALFCFLYFTFFSVNFSISSIESRYYYVVGLPLFFIALDIVGYYNNKLHKYLFVVIIVISLLANLLRISEQIQKLSENGIMRNKITNELVKKLNFNRNAIIIYVSGDRSYYGLPDLRYPFQSGLGNILAVHLYNNGNFINEKFFDNTKTIQLYNINSTYTKANSEGTHPFDSKKYGFYFTTESLCNDLSNEYFTKQDIQAFNVTSENDIKKVDVDEILNTCFKLK